MLAYPGALFAQQRMPVVGLLWNDSVKPSPYAAILAAGLRERGYVVGRNLRFEDAVALEGYGPMASNAATLVQAKVDLIVTYGATATLAAAKATQDIPIVMIIGADPVATGVVKSLSHPGGNATGIWTFTSGLNAKRMELLKELKPSVRRAGLLFAPGSAVQIVVDDAEGAAHRLKIEIVRAEVRAPDKIDAAVAKLVQLGADAIYVHTSSMLSAHSRSVVESVAKRRLPAVYGTERYAEAGGLLTYYPSLSKAFGRAAGQIDRILKGARPGDLPIDQVSDVELVINLRAARELGITIPQSILQRADRAIE